MPAILFFFSLMFVGYILRRIGSSKAPVQPREPDISQQIAKINSIRVDMLEATLKHATTQLAQQNAELMEAMAKLPTRQALESIEADIARDPTLDELDRAILADAMAREERYKIVVQTLLSRQGIDQRQIDSLLESVEHPESY